MIRFLVPIIIVLAIVILIRWSFTTNRDPRSVGFALIVGAFMISIAIGATIFAVAVTQP